MTARGRRLAVDPGTVRIGVAVSDPDGLVATPLTTVSSGPTQWEQLVALVAEQQAAVVVVGLPRQLSGAEGPAATAARTFAVTLAERVPCPVRLFDERLTTVTAQRDLRAAGRSSRKGRSVVDQAAATVLLQAYLDAERAGSSQPGEPADPRDAATDLPGVDR